MDAYEYDDDDVILYYLEMRMIYDDLFELADFPIIFGDMYDDDFHNFFHCFKSKNCFKDFCIKNNNKLYY